MNQLTANLNLDISPVVQRMISRVRNNEEKVFEDSLRTMASPPIKGDITKGKIKWRGIRMVCQNDGLKHIKWLEQRGKQISPKISYELLNQNNVYGTENS